MPKPVKELRDMEIDEISLVDRPAAQHAEVVITKRATEEDIVPEDIYNEEGELLDVDLLDTGDVVFDEDGDAFLVVDDEMEEEYETVGKAAAYPDYPEEGQSKKEILRAKMLAQKKKQMEEEGVKKSFADELREELSKSYSDADRDEVIAKALAEVDEMAFYAAEAEEVAKSERDLRLTREYEEVAKNYNLPVDEEELAPVLMAIAEELPYEYGAVIHKALSAAGEIIFDEIGTEGYATNNDVLNAVDYYIDQNISKADISKAEAVEAVFDENPAAYDEYMATRYGY